LIFARAMWRSATVAWRGLDTTGRSISLVALQLLGLLAPQLQLFLAARHVALASFWSQVVLGIIIVPVVSVLTALVYLDATGHETTRTRGQ
ncbi:MAG: hypothetical protein M3N13_02775, partial [Candidatus Eremiobacteraeota bacterium]|nr:hypothetical protein [Candidatus Eremiobacteraeota bacterium]